MGDTMEALNLIGSVAGLALKRSREKVSASRKLVIGTVVGAFSLLSLALAPTASAGIIVTNVQFPYLDSFTLTQTGSSPANLFGGIGIGQTRGVAGGQIILTTNMGIFYTWCIDLFHGINGGPQNTPYMAGPPLDDNGTYLGGPTVLTATQIATIAKLAAYGNLVMAATPSSSFSGALQAAIWNVEYGTTASGSGAFNADLAAIMALLPTLPYADGEVLYSPLVTGTHDRQALWHPVPEPSSLAMIALGLLSLLGFGMMRVRAGV